MATLITAVRRHLRSQGGIKTLVKEIPEVTQPPLIALSLPFSSLSSILEKSPVIPASIHRSNAIAHVQRLRFLCLAESSSLNCGYVCIGRVLL
jgi:hypothetical protein